MISFVRNFVDKISNTLFNKVNFILDSKISELLSGFDEEILESEAEEKIESKNSAKRKYFESSLEDGIVSLHFDPRVSGVRIPEKYSNYTDLILNYSYNFGIPDLLIDDRQVIATLSFGGQQYQCIVPWDAVISIMKNTQNEKKTNLSIKRNKSELEKSDKPKPKLTLIKGGKS